jgi:hypothetical protein
MTPTPHTHVRQIASVHIFTDEEFNQYQCKAYDTHGTRYPEADYFTRNREDAEDAAAYMLDKCHLCA